MVVGLGNPGPEYAATRHNVGFMAVDALAKRLGRFSGWSGDSAASRGRGRAGRHEALLVKPQQYMNRSGLAVRALLAEGWIAEEILVVCDDVYLPLGTIRVRPRGGTGGHQGLESIVASAGTDGFARLRIGVGPAPEADRLKEYVLEPFTDEEQSVLPRVIEAAAQAAHDAVAEGLTQAMNRWNRFVLDPVEP
ncbi:MAG TPA: aminoacyl-tRNA hydrolase [Candidatus Eisenbacteria bacterium]